MDTSCTVRKKLLWTRKYQPNSIIQWIKDMVTTYVVWSWTVFIRYKGFQSVVTESDDYLLVRETM